MTDGSTAQCDPDDASGVPQAIGKNAQRGQALEAGARDRVFLMSLKPECWTWILDGLDLLAEQFKEFERDEQDEVRKLIAVLSELGTEQVAGGPEVAGYQIVLRDGWTKQVIELRSQFCFDWSKAERDEQQRLRVLAQQLPVLRRAATIARAKLVAKRAGRPADEDGLPIDAFDQ